MTLSATLSVFRSHGQLVFHGELDAFDAAELRRRLDDAVAAGVIHFTIDASGVTFIDAGGLDALVRLRNTARAAGGNLTVSAASWVFVRTATLAGLAHAFEPDPRSALPTRRRTMRVDRRHVDLGRPAYLRVQRLGAPLTRTGLYGLLLEAGVPPEQADTRLREELAAAGYPDDGTLVSHPDAEAILNAILESTSSDGDPAVG